MCVCVEDVWVWCVCVKGASVEGVCVCVCGGCVGVVCVCEGCECGGGGCVCVCVRLPFQQLNSVLSFTLYSATIVLYDCNYINTRTSTNP